MRTLKLTLAYDGTRYGGWQTQRGHQASKPTIQETLERALHRILREPVRVIGSGRTDAGAHALAQVAHARIRSAMPCARLMRSLNYFLPRDIAVTRLEDARETFHAQFHASRKQYRYRIFVGEVVPPFIRSYVHHVRVPLNVTRMRREAASLRGRHDFRAFARSGGEGVRTTTWILHAISLARRGSELQLEVEGNGFLHTMVRSIAGTLIDVGRGRLPAGTLRRMLKTGNRELTGTTAPARGLALVTVRYG